MELLQSTTSVLAAIIIIFIIIIIIIIKLNYFIMTLTSKVEKIIFKTQRGRSFFYR